MTMICPNCGSDTVTVQVMQEQRGSVTKSKTKSKYKEKGHGLIWWFTIGWWWWMVDLASWIVFFVPRLIMRLFAKPYKKKKYKGTSTTTTATVNKISYKKIYACQNCGHTWKENA